MQLPREGKGGRPGGANPPQLSGYRESCGSQLALRYTPKQCSLAFQPSSFHIQSPLPNSLSILHSSLQMPDFPVNNLHVIWSHHHSWLLTGCFGDIREAEYDQEISYVFFYEFGDYFDLQRV